MITERQEKILNFLVQEYIKNAEPVSSKLLKKSANLAVSEATIRNDLQDLAKQGFIEQPHTSAGRMPTEKAYRYFSEIIVIRQETKFSIFISREIEKTKREIDNELKLVKEFMDSLEEISSSLEFKENELTEILPLISSSKNLYQKHMDLMKKLIDEIEK